MRVWENSGLHQQEGRSHIWRSNRRKQFREEDCDMPNIWKSARVCSASILFKLTSITKRNTRRLQLELIANAPLWKLTTQI